MPSSSSSHPSKDATTLAPGKLSGVLGAESKPLVESGSSFNFFGTGGAGGSSATLVFGDDRSRPGGGGGGGTFTIVAEAAEATADPEAIPNRVVGTSCGGG